MDLALSAEQEQLGDALREFLRQSSSPDHVRAAMASEEGYDPEMWRRMSDQLRLPALIVPERFGGDGFGFVELGVVMHEMGRALACAPFFATVCQGVVALLESGDEETCAAWLPEIASGRRLITLALVEPGGSCALEDIATTATSGPSGWSLDGVKDFVLDGMIADLVIVAARTTSGISLFAVDPTSAGLTRTPLNGADPTRRQARLRFDHVPAALIGGEGQSRPVLRRVLALGAVALGCEQVGVAERALELAVEHVTTREQFGRPIGAFQAIKHTLADDLVELEAARSSAWYGLWAATAAGDEILTAAHVAKASCSDAAYRITADVIQLHGAIGITWEHPAHLYFKRALTSKYLLGAPRWHRDRLLDRIGYEAETPASAATA